MTLIAAGKMTTRCRWSFSGAQGSSMNPGQISLVLPRLHRCRFHRTSSCAKCLQYATSTMCRILYGTACTMTRQRSAGSGSGGTACDSTSLWTKKVFNTHRSTNSGSLYCANANRVKRPCRSGWTARLACELWPEVTSRIVVDLHSSVRSVAPSMRPSHLNGNANFETAGARPPALDHSA